MGNSPWRTCQPMSPVTAWSESRCGVRRWRTRTRTRRAVSAQNRPSRQASVIGSSWGGGAAPGGCLGARPAGGVSARRRGRGRSSAGEAQAEDRREVGPEVGEEPRLGLAALPEAVHGRDLEDPPALPDGLVEEPDGVVPIAVEDRRNVEPVEEGPSEDQGTGQVG